jgi:hypothetical protein
MQAINNQLNKHPLDPYMVYRNWTWIHSIGMTGNPSAVGNCHIFKKHLTDGMSIVAPCWENVGLLVC